MFPVSTVVSRNEKLTATLLLVAQALPSVLKGMNQHLSIHPSLSKAFNVERYTCNAVLRVLCAYGTGRDFDSEPGEAIEYYKVLAHKGLSLQAEPMLSDIKSRALAGDNASV